MEEQEELKGLIGQKLERAHFDRESVDHDSGSHEAADFECFEYFGTVKRM